MRGRIKTIVQYMFFLGLGLFLIWYSVRSLSPSEKIQLLNSFRDANYWYLVPVTIIMLLSHLSRAFRWKILMEPLGYKPSTGNTYIAVLIGYLFNLLVPRLGEVMKCTVLARYEKAAPDKLIGTIVAERAFDVVGLLLVVIIMLITQWQQVGNVFVTDIRKAFLSSSGNIQWWKPVLIVLLISLGIYLMNVLLKKNKRNLFVLRVLKAFRNITKGLGTIRSLRHPWWFILHTVFIWLCYLIAIWVGFLAFAPVEHLQIGAALSILVFGSFGMIVTQGGIGAYQLAVQRTLSLYGISLVAGLSFGWILWGVQTIIVIVFGAIAFMLLPIINQKKKPLTNTRQP